MSLFYQNRHQAYYSFLSYNTTYPSHIHKQIELIYVIEGSICVTINQESSLLKAGGFALVSPNTIHSIETITKSEIFFVIFDIETVSDYSTELLKKRLVMPFLSINDLHPNVAICINTLISEKYTEQDLKLVKGYLSIILGHTIPILKLENISFNELTEISQKMLTYIDNNFLEPLTLELLSKKLGINKFQLSRIFSKKLNITFTTYLNNKRLEFAKSLLKNTELSITNISFESGFSSTRTFYRAFKENFKMTPKEYRKNIFLK